MLHTTLLITGDTQLQGILLTEFFLFPENIYTHAENCLKIDSELTIKSDVVLIIDSKKCD